MKKSCLDFGALTTLRKVVVQVRQDPRESPMKPALKKNLADMAIDLSSSTRQETKKEHEGTGFRGCSDSERLKGLHPEKVGAL